MTESRASASERLLVSVGVSVTVACYACVVWLIFSMEPGWGTRLILMSVAAVFALGSALLVRSAWRHSLTLPLPPGSANSWLVRQSWWVLTLIWLAVLGLPGLIFGVVESSSHHLPPPAVFLVPWIVGSMIAAPSLALMQRVNWRRRVENLGNGGAGR
jgi:hypothetical protein